MNIDDPHRHPRRLPRRPRRRRWLLALDVAGVAMTIPAIVYPYLLIYVLLLAAVLVALAAFVLLAQMPVVVLGRLIRSFSLPEERAWETPLRGRRPRGGRESL